VVVGNSYGAGVAAWLAERHPERVARLVLSDGLVSDYPMALADSIARTRGEPSMQAVMSFRDHHDVSTIVHIALFHKVPVPGSLTKQYYTRWVQPHQPAQTELLHDLVANEALFVGHRFTWPMPVYFIWGERDDLIPNAVGLAQMARNGIPADHWYTVDGGGHVPMLEKPHRFVQVLRAVLARR
jgi:pimeloyl-ACP methyl ester carboxylesterase